MSRRVLHVDTAATWRGGQNQVLLTARGMAARGVEATIARNSTIRSLTFSKP
jgi:hypothetical protein